MKKFKQQVKITGSKLALLLLFSSTIMAAASVGVVSGQNGTVTVSCFHCHSTQLKEFKKSIHFQEGVSCADCHGGAMNINGTTISIGVMDVNFTGTPSKPNITKICSKCHEKDASLYKKSVHWKEIAKGHLEAPSCIDCHKYHDIIPSKNPISPTYSENVPQLCAECHENQTKMSAWYYGIKTDRFDTYKKSYHYKALVSGGKGLAVCSDCHENHDTKSESDPTSSIYPANLPKTCGKTGCHPVESKLISGGKIHEERSVYLLSIDVKKFVTYFYIIMILFEITFTLGLIFLDISSKFELKRR